MSDTHPRLTDRQIDSKLRHLYYRSHLFTGMVLLLLVVTMGLVARRQHLLADTEWEGVAMQQADVPCVRSYPMSDQYSQWWVKTYLIEGKEKTIGGSEGCLAGRQYRVSYRIGNTGYVDINEQTLIESPRK
ncbi:MAG: hypothetical protein QM758_15675 [Armatimonas sp.]